MYCSFTTTSISKPKLLILDEPTAGVDVDIRKETWSFLESINRAGTTIILTTHYLEEAEEIAALNLAKFRKAQANLAESEGRADLNEHALAKIRSKGRAGSAAPLVR